MSERIYNFNAGPGVLPLSVLELSQLAGSALGEGKHRILPSCAEQVDVPRQVCRARLRLGSQGKERI